MSNERIDQILEVNGVYIAGGMRKRIINSMEQYGGDMYDKGLSEAFTNTNRLQALVQAQKELIELLTPYTPYVHRDMGTLKEIQNKIKSLEK